MKFKQRSISLFLLITFVIQSILVAEVGARESDAGKVSPIEVLVETNKGAFTLELYPDKAPLTVANFLAYVDDGFYDNTVFHRVIADFVIQGGGFEKGMKPRKTRKSVKSESNNRLKNLRGTIAMARKTHPDTATSQFFVNLQNNHNLDWKAGFQPGYTVFGRVSQGMDVIQKIANVPTTTLDRMRNVPVEDIIILSARHKESAAAKKVEDEAAINNAETAAQDAQEFIAGEHYAVLDRPVPTRDDSKIEVVEMFSYGCPHCFEFEASIKQWSQQQAGDVDFWFFPAVWNKPMALYAQAFYAARKLNVADNIHQPLFTAIVMEQKTIRNEDDLASFFAQHGVDKEAFTDAFNSAEVKNQVRHAQERVSLYKPVGVPEIVVNGKYRIDRMRAGGLPEMLAVLDYLVAKERAGLQQ